MSERLRGITVLLVEDEFLILLDLQYILESEGAVVKTATSVREGLAAVENGFGAAVLDVALPDGEVFPVAERLSESGVPIVFHSGHARATEIGRRFPEATTLSKPATERVLLDAVARQIAA